MATLIGLSLVIYLCLTLLLRRIRVDLLLPSSVLVGLLLCLVGPNGFGRRMGETFEFYQGILEEFSIFSKMPSELINFVFAGIFLGQTVPGLSAVWRTSKPHLLVGYWLGLGQHLVGVLLGGLLISRWLGVTPSMGTLLPISFQGGHGTVAGLSTIFDTSGMKDATQIGYAISTVGVILAVLVGSLAVKSFKSKEDPSSDNEGDSTQAEPPQHTDIMMALGLLWAIIFLAKTLRHLGVMFVDQPLGVDLFQYLPVFPIAMILGFLWQRLIGVGFLGGNARYIVKQIQNIALFLLLLSAIASLEFKTILSHWQVVLVLSIAGILWNLGSLWLITPRFFAGKKLAGIGEFCQCSGTSAIGLKFVKYVSREAEEGFNYKQILYEPLLGGGLFTALAIPLVQTLGWAIYCVVMALLLFVILFVHRWGQRRSAAE